MLICSLKKGKANKHRLPRFANMMILFLVYLRLSFLLDDKSFSKSLQLSIASDMLLIDTFLSVTCINEIIFSCIQGSEGLGISPVSCESTIRQHLISNGCLPLFFS